MARGLGALTDLAGIIGPVVSRGFAPGLGGGSGLC